MELLEKEGVPTNEEELSLGDFIIQGQDSVGVLYDVLTLERKTDHDFLSSVADGRLNEQLYRMSTTYKHSILILEGRLKEACVHRKFRYKSAVAAFCNGTVKRSNDGVQGAVSFIQTWDVYETRDYLVGFHNAVKEGRNLTRHPRIVTAKINKDLNYQLVEFLANMPMIGESVAINLLTHFENILLVMTADADELLEVPLVGPERAEAIYNFFRRNYIPE